VIAAVVMPPQTSSHDVAIALLQDEVARLRRDRDVDQERIREVEKCATQLKIVHLKWLMVVRMTGWAIGIAVGVWQLLWPVVREFWR